MESYEALANTINRKTAVHAKALGLALSTVSKWQEPSMDFSDSGALNPLDRVETMIQTALILGQPLEQALSPVFYLGDRFEFVPLLLSKGTPNLSDITKQLHRVVKEVGSVIHVSSEALEDGKITPDERRAIEREAQNLYAELGRFLKMIQIASKTD